MNNRNDVERKLEAVLESLDGIKRAEPAPFFFTRLKARLEREEKNVWELAGAYLAKPVIAIAGLAIVLCINVFILLEKNASGPMESAAVVPVEEFVLNTSNSNFDYVNLEP